MKEVGALEEAEKQGGNQSCRDLLAMLEALVFTGRGIERFERWSYDMTG